MISMAINPAGWVKHAAAAATTAVASASSVAGKQHVIYSITAALASTARGTLKLLETTSSGGSTALLETTIYNAATITFPAGVAITPSRAAKASLNTTSTGTRQASIHGITRGA